MSKTTNPIAPPKFSYTTEELRNNWIYMFMGMSTKFDVQRIRCNKIISATQFTHVVNLVWIILI